MFALVNFSLFLMEMTYIVTYLIGNLFPYFKYVLIKK
jgi:hypothetical protein